jgi:hypothetical protein
MVVERDTGRDTEAVEITSGGTGGPEPDPSLYELFQRGNLCGDLPGAPRPEDLAYAFVALGWSARRSAFFEYDVAHAWAKLTLWEFKPGETMVSGLVHPDHFEELAAVFTRLGVRYSLEFADVDGNEIVLRSDP